MKKIYAIITMATALVACSREEQSRSIEDPEAPTYTLTIEATKGEDGADASKALTIDDSGAKNVLNATWAYGEAVTVYNVTRSATLTGTLTAQSSGASTTLKGTLTGTIEDGDELKLTFLSPDYASQDGTLEYIASHCDYAEATVTVTDVSTPSVTTSAANFVNQQAIVKFALKNKATDAAIAATSLTVNDGTNTYAVAPASATSELYVAIPGFSGQTITLEATDGSDDFSYEKSGVSFTSGQYYEIAVKMKQWITYTVPTTIDDLKFNGDKNNIDGSPQALVNAGSVNHGTIYYSTDGTDWGTDVPTGTNAGSYTVYYKIEPDENYLGGVASTSLDVTMEQTRGWCTLSNTMSSGWGSYYTKEAYITVNHHGGKLDAFVSPWDVEDLLNITITDSTNTIWLEKPWSKQIQQHATLYVYSESTSNYLIAMATYSMDP